MKVGMVHLKFQPTFYLFYLCNDKALSIYFYLSSISVLFIIISTLQYITDNPDPTYFPFMIKYHIAIHILVLVYS